MLNNKDLRVIDYLTRHGYKIKRAFDVRYVQKYDADIANWNKKTGIAGKIRTVYSINTPNGDGQDEIDELLFKDLLSAEAKKFNIK